MRLYEHTYKCIPSLSTYKETWTFYSFFYNAEPIKFLLNCKQTRNDLCLRVLVISLCIITIYLCLQYIKIPIPYDRNFM